jgi:hypothetical protein
MPVECFAGTRFGAAQPGVEGRAQMIWIAKVPTRAPAAGLLRRSKIFIVTEIVSAKNMSGC